MILNVQLRTKWPPDDITIETDDNITMATNNDKLLDKTRQLLLELPTTNSPIGSLHSSPGGSPYLSPKEIDSPSELSPMGSSHSSPWESVHSSPCHSPQPYPQGSLQDESTSFEDTAADKNTSDDTKPTVPIRSTSMSPPSISQFQQLLDNTPTSPTHQVSICCCRAAGM